MPNRINRCWFNAAAPGVGNITPGTALAGFRTLGAAQNGWVLDGVTIADAAGNWETRNGCAYNSGTNTLTRGTLEDSSSGSAINFGAAVTVFVDLSALLQTAHDQTMVLDIRMAGVRTTNTAAQNASALTTFLGLLGPHDKVIMVREPYPMDPVSVSNVTFLGNNMAAFKGSAPAGGTPGVTALFTGGGFIISSTAAPAFTIGDRTGFECLVFHHVQPYGTTNPASLTTYPPTIKKAANKVASIRIRRNAFVGCTKSIELRGTNGTSDYLFDIEVEQNYAYPLGGTFLDLAWVLDIPRVYGNHVNPGAGVSYLGMRTEFDNIAVTPQVIDNVCLNGAPAYIMERADEFVMLANFVFGGSTGYRVIDSYGQLTNCTADQVNTGAHITFSVGNEYKYVFVDGIGVIPSAGNSVNRNGIKIDGAGAGNVKIMAPHGILSAAGPVPSSQVTAAANALVQVAGSGAHTVYVMAPTKAAISTAWTVAGIDKPNAAATVHVWPDVPPWSAGPAQVLRFRELFAGSAGSSVASRNADVGGGYTTLAGTLTVSAANRGYGTGSGGNYLTLAYSQVSQSFTAYLDATNLGGSSSLVNMGMLACRNAGGTEQYQLRLIFDNATSLRVHLVRVASSTPVTVRDAAATWLGVGATARIRWVCETAAGSSTHTVSYSLDSGASWTAAFTTYVDSSALTGTVMGIGGDFASGATSGIHIDTVEVYQ